MNIKFLDIHIRGFLSIGEAQVKLDNQGFTLISGINNCLTDNAKSNGVGKSSISEAIVYCLTGETIRRTTDVVNKYTSDGLMIKLSFIIDKDRYEVIRYREDKEFGTNLKLFINGEDKSGKGIRDTQKILEEYLPDLNSQLLGSVIILGQGLPEKFSNNTPSGRKEILEKLSKSDFMIQDIKDKLSTRKDLLNSQLRTQEDLYLQNNTKLTLSQNNLIKLQQELQDLENHSLSEFNEQDINSKIEEFKLQIEQIDIELDSLHNSISDDNEKLNSLQAAQKLEEGKIYLKYDEPLKLLIKSISDKNAEINSLNKEIVKLKNIKDICPTCGQKLPDVHKVDTSEMEQELEACETNLAQLQEQFESEKEKQDTELKSLASEYDNLREDRNLILRKNVESEKLLTSNKFNFQEQINNLQRDLDRYKLMSEQYQKNKDRLSNDIVTCDQQIKSLQDLLYNINIEKDNINQHLDIVNKMITIASRDFRGMLLFNIIDYINLKAKEYSKDIFNTSDIEFKLDGNNIYIGYAGKQYESLSGGEKQKVDLIVQFSIRDMLSKFLNFTSNILVLDEIFDNLDSYGCQQVINLISTKLLDIESIFIITHHLELDIPNDNEIIIVKNNNGISEIQ